MELVKTGMAPGHGARQLLFLGVPVATRASARALRVLADIGCPFSRAPAPALASKISSLTGLTTQAKTGRPASTRHAATVQSLPPLKKSRVPSMGSTIQTRDRDRRVSCAGLSSESQP